MLFIVVVHAIGPHPFPRIVQYAQSVIGREIREQIMEKEGRLPDAIAACIGGGSNLIGAVHEFLDDKEVELHGVEPEHSAALTNGTVGIMQGLNLLCFSHHLEMLHYLQNL